MTKKLIHCPKCGKGSFISLNEKEEKRKVRKKDFDKMVEAMFKIPPPKNWKEREKR
ncbi:protein of unknown function [endosymbiont DhMRE of Dentiscutata heterogama]|uniref:hypothetical protein n=1 Tax=endosymbiont DhMRE of Dentiscutata heterogama TaxID=1609546 RepID=UPI000629D585|nr:hypothetical protein [endosymbiont DhMRE of Dentiscutata heterogama]CFW92741.1 protein of unknown function [endosymbiont DhMRE of Dentiscutata heterogama]CFW92869.1 protein of unknown function [endosymbiont DhMRE of Dentiscutata heterogama]CFW93111.1 protein of unknown function [endosymbiont DhMRE of Dentiscutata heterogama]